MDLLRKTSPFITLVLMTACSPSRSKMAAIPTVREQSQNNFTSRSLKPQSVPADSANLQQAISSSVSPTPNPSPMPTASPTPNEQSNPIMVSPTPMPGPNSQRPAQPNPGKPDPAATSPKQEFTQESNQSPDNAANKSATPLSDQQIVEKVAQQGVPREAIERVVTFLKTTATRTLTVKADSGHLQEMKVGNRIYASIIDYSKRSSEKRFYLVHLPTGQVKKFYVAHGVNSGMSFAEHFSNVPGSKQTSLGMYVTGAPFQSSKGPSMFLYGLEPSNDQAYDREIILHGARYVSLDFLNKYNRLGRSWGCPALSQEITRVLIPLISNGSVLYAYHSDLMRVAAASSAVQIVSRNQEAGAQESNQIVPEEVDP